MRVTTCVTKVAAFPPQARVRAISEIVDQLVRGVKENIDVHLPLVRRDACAKYSLARAPKLVEIISAVPDDFRDTLLPRCASGTLLLGVAHANAL